MQSDPKNAPTGFAPAGRVAPFKEYALAEFELTKAGEAFPVDALRNHFIAAVQAKRSPSIVVEALAMQVGSQIFKLAAAMKNPQDGALRFLERVAAASFSFEQQAAALKEMEDREREEKARIDQAVRR